MRNLAEKWAVVPDWQTATIEGRGFSIKSVSGLNQLLVSGDLEAWNRKAGFASSGVGAFGVAAGNPYAVRIARDRILAVSTQSFDIAAGWHDGVAVTEVSAALHVFEISGPSLADLVSQAVTVDPRNAGPSAALSFGGANASAYYHESTQVLRVHIDRGLASYLWSWLENIGQPA
jgi:hypothetical protein